MLKQKVCVVTGTRAEYGLLRGVVEALSSNPKFELQLVATAMHLSPEFGQTYKEIEEDGFKIDDTVEMLLSSDSAVGITKSMGLGLIGLADSYRRLQPDLVILLGDRFETMVAAQAAMIARIPIAHLHGGEITEGAVDESIRHAITKMSHLHFVSTEEYRRRVIQMGEEPSRVVVSGAPGIDNIKRQPLLSPEQLQESLGFQFREQNFLVTYHPVTLAESPQSNSMDSLLKALDHFPEAGIIITLPNADAASRGLIADIRSFAAERPQVGVYSSLGMQRYLSAIAAVDLAIGNSSSGLLEVPSFGKATVNIGDRQKGRMRAASVIDCEENEQSIVAAIEKGLSDGFRELSRTVINPYGDGEAVERIMTVLESTDFSTLSRKPFNDLAVKG